VLEQDFLRCRSRHLTSRGALVRQTLVPIEST
jgi:hypothetical protein